MIVEASLGGFLRTVVILGLSYYAIRFIFRLFTNKGETSKRNRGKDTATRDKKKNDLGEYVDFEEVDE